MPTHTFTLEPVPPFRLDLTAWILRRRPENEIDRWDGETYSRVLILDGLPTLLRLRQAGSPSKPKLEVSLEGPQVSPSYEPAAAAAVARIFGIYTDLSAFYTFAEGVPELKLWVKLFKGAKPTRYPTLFEALTNAISCQQLSLTVGILLLNRLAHLHGSAFQTAGGLHYAFPQAQALRGADPEELRAIGYSFPKARYILGLAELVSSGGIDLDSIAMLDDQQALEAICAVRGIGRWSGEYFLLRGLGRTHIFPGDDVGARNHLQRWMELPDKLDYAGVSHVFGDWNPFGGLIYFHLLLKGLMEAGNFQV